MDWLHAFWKTLTPDMQTAVVGAAATVTAATLGAIAVIWQIGRQADAAIRQNRHTEELKLKLQVYEQIAQLCRETSNAEIDFATAIRKFRLEIDVSRQQAAVGHPFSIPSGRAEDMMRLNNGVSRSAVDLMSAIERWEIIDLRLEIFRTALSAALHDLREAASTYFLFALPLMPRQRDDSGQGTLFPWRPPDDNATERVRQLGDRVIDAANDLGCYVYDLRIEMQNLLLGDLFDNRVPPRAPIDPKHMVIRLAQHEKLAAHFDQETDWGREKSKAEERARAQVATVCKERFPPDG